MEEQKCIIKDLNTLCNNCGFFDSESSVNSGYGCLHKDYEDDEIKAKREFTYGFNMCYHWLNKT